MHEQHPEYQRQKLPSTSEAVLFASLLSLRIWRCKRVWVEYANTQALYVNYPNQPSVHGGTVDNTDHYNNSILAERLVHPATIQEFGDN